MKILKGRTHLFPSILSTILLFTTFLYFFFGTMITQMFSVHWLFILLAIFFIFTSIGKTQLGETKIYTFHEWISRLFLILIIFSFIQLGIQQLIFQSLPIMHSDALSPHSLNQINFKWGLFPFEFYAIIAIVFAYCRYCDNQKGLMSEILFPFFKTSTLSDIGVAIDTYIRASIFFSLNILVSFAALIIIYFSQLLFKKSFPLGFNLKTVIAATFISFIVNNKFFKRGLRFLSAHGFPFPAIIILFSGIASLVFWGCYQLLDYLSPLSSGLNFTLNLFNSSHWIFYESIMNTMMWIAWTPLIAAMIAYVSKGQSIRQTVLFTSILSLISFNIGNLLVSQINSSIFLFLTLISIVTLLSLLFKKPFSTYLIRATIPNPVTDIKTRSPFLFIQRLLESSTTMIMSYLAIGIYALSYFSVIMVMPGLILMLMSVLVLLRRLKESGVKYTHDTTK